MSDFKYFEGKICTIITRETNRNFKEEAIAMKRPELYPVNLLDHFVGRIIHSDKAGITLEHPLIKTRSYFRVEHIIAVIEEQELERNPENEKIIEEIKNKNNPSRGKITCPNGHSLNIPVEIPDGSEVICPKCKVEFILKLMEKPIEKPVPKTELVDIDFLNKLSQEAKSQHPR